MKKIEELMYCTKHNEIIHKEYQKNNVAPTCFMCAREMVEKYSGEKFNTYEEYYNHAAKNYRKYWKNLYWEDIANGKKT